MLPPSPRLRRAGTLALSPRRGDGDSRSLVFIRVGVGVCDRFFLKEVSPPFRTGREGPIEDEHEDEGMSPPC